VTPEAPSSRSPEVTCAVRREADPASSPNASAAPELRITRPLLRVQRLADRAVGCGFVMMLAASAVLIGSFLLSSPDLQKGARHRGA
jgi:hypothetical protein